MKEYIKIVRMNNDKRINLNNLLFSLFCWSDAAMNDERPKKRNVLKKLSF